MNIAKIMKSLIHYHIIINTYSAPQQYLRSEAKCRPMQLASNVCFQKLHNFKFDFLKMAQNDALRIPPVEPQISESKWQAQTKTRLSA